MLDFDTLGTCFNHSRLTMAEQISADNKGVFFRCVSYSDEVRNLDVATLHEKAKLTVGWQRVRFSHFCPEKFRIVDLEYSVKRYVGAHGKKLLVKHVSEFNRFFMALGFGDSFPEVLEAKANEYLFKSSSELDAQPTLTGQKTVVTEVAQKKPSTSTCLY